MWQFQMRVPNPSTTKHIMEDIDGDLDEEDDLGFLFRYGIVI